VFPYAIGMQIARSDKLSAAFHGAIPAITPTG